MFFKKVAEQIALRGDESLLDIGCGPGLLAIGFAPFVGSCTGLDPEPGMIAAAKDAAAEAGVALSLIEGRIEEFPTTQTYDVITIGRAHHWLERTPTLKVLERILAPDSGRILLCRASGVETPETPWVKPYRKVRSACPIRIRRGRHRSDFTPTTHQHGLPTVQPKVGLCPLLIAFTVKGERARRVTVEQRLQNIDSRVFAVEVVQQFSLTVRSHSTYEHELAARS